MSKPKNSATRFILEGTWTGYTSSQQRVVHRRVFPVTRRKLRAWAEKTWAITYTDGTSLIISVKDAKPREKVKEIRGYDSLINDCFHYDVSSVQELKTAREALHSLSEG